MMKSWKTTAAGVVAFLAALFGELSAAIDGNPETVADWNVVVAAGVIAAGLIFSRDNNVTSESAGAK